MCGISGFYHRKGGLLQQQERYETLLTKMNHVQKHRGPDGEGIYLDNHCGFAHVRLSILDISRGAQPMELNNRYEDYVIIYNGEIYNMNSLRRELEAQGISFSTTCDTEVLLKGYAFYGTNVFQKLNGIFAFAIWEKRKKKLTLCRDRLGVKPLFYASRSDKLVFGSEIKTLLTCCPDLAATNQQGLCELFALGPAHTPGKTAYSHIKEVLPGTYLTIEADTLTHHTYWSLTGAPHTDSLSETIERVRYLVTDAVTMQMLSDIPICTFLSGGLDSSVVTAITARELEKQGKQLSTYSFDFQGNEEYFKANKFQPTQDLPFALEMAQTLSTNHTLLQCDNTRLYTHLQDALKARDFPCMADVESSLLYFCGEVSKHHKVTLTGECADEIFGGYPWFYREDMFERDAFPWSYDMNPRKVLLKDSILEKLPLDTYASHAYQHTISETPRLISDTKEERRRRELSYLNLRWFMATLLERMDRTSMYHGLEARVPFADHRIVEYLYNVPWSMKFLDNTEKGLLRHAMKGLLPDNVLFRKKSPYPKTYHPGYEQLLKQEFVRIMEDKSEPANIFIDKKKAYDFLHTPLSYNTPWYGQLMAGPQLLAYYIQINLWLKLYNIKVDL